MDQLLKNIHVFPSEASYDKNIGSVADSDLALVPIKIDFWDTVPIGLPMMWFSNTLPSDRCIFIEGQYLNKNEYPELFALWGTTFGDNGDTFRCPDVMHRHAMVSNSFGVIRAGIPDLYGIIYHVDKGNHGTGVFARDADWSASIRHGDGDDWGDKTSFSASRYNGLYGSSSTVAVDAFKVRLICRAK